MTAEIAILNKSAVALATDSAVTISAGPKEEKIYFTADKLFELSRTNPIGIMIYNGMQFMQAPLHMLINEYREQCRSFDYVEDAANDFLDYLNNWGRTAPREVVEQAAVAVLAPLANRIVERITAEITNLVRQGLSGDSLSAQVPNVIDDVLAQFEQIYESTNDAIFIGNRPRLTNHETPLSTRSSAQLDLRRDLTTIGL